MTLIRPQTPPDPAAALPLALIALLILIWGGCGAVEWGEKLPNGYEIIAPGGPKLLMGPSWRPVLGQYSSVTLRGISGDEVFGQIDHGAYFYLHTLEGTVKTFPSLPSLKSFLEYRGITNTRMRPPGPFPIPLRQMFLLALVIFPALIVAFNREQTARRRWVVAWHLTAGSAHGLPEMIRRVRHCPRCRYDLRGAVSTVCTECGLELTGYALEITRSARRGKFRRPIILFAGLLPSIGLLVHLWYTPVGYTDRVFSSLAAFTFALPTIPAALLWWLLLRASDRARSPFWSRWGALLLLAAACAWPFTYYVFRGWD